jgi:hypothetical protein
MYLCRSVRETVSWSSCDRLLLNPQQHSRLIWACRDREVKYLLLLLSLMTLLLCRCRDEEKDAYLYYILKVHGCGRTLVFCTSIAALRRVTAILRLLQVSVWPLHAQMQQKQRLKVPYYLPLPSIQFFYRFFLLWVWGGLVKNSTVCLSS